MLLNMSSEQLGGSVSTPVLTPVSCLLTCCVCSTRRYTLLHVAAGLGQTDTLRLLLKHLGSSSSLVNDSNNDDGATPLHAAAMAGSTPAAQLLLSSSADAGIAGADGSQAWEVVPEAVDAGGAANKQQQTQQQDDRLQALRKLLQEAARKAGRSQPTRSSKVTSQSQIPVGGAAAAAAATGAQQSSPVDEYSEHFRQLSAAEQQRRVEGFARLLPTELRDVSHLSSAAKAAIVQVRGCGWLVGWLGSWGAPRGGSCGGVGWWC